MLIRLLPSWLEKSSFQGSRELLTKIVNTFLKHGKFSSTRQLLTPHQKQFWIVGTLQL